jgi:hypothetical protein
LPVLPPVNLTVTVETGVVVFTLLGTNPHDWTRDTLSFPVGPAAPEAAFVSGVAAASPTSFLTPMKNVPIVDAGDETVFVSGSDSNNDQFSGSGVVQLPAFPVPPPVGFAIDSAEISHGQTGQATLTLAPAVFGNCAAMLRASYTAYIITRPGTGVTVGGEQGGLSA